MQVKFTDTAVIHLEKLKKNNEQINLKKIRNLIENIKETPYLGIGKPEALKYEYSGFWSRRINKEDRLIYNIKDEILIIYSLKGHYEK